MKELEEKLGEREEEKLATVEEAAAAVQHGRLESKEHDQADQMADAAEEAGAPAHVHHPDDVAAHSHLGHPMFGLPEGLRNGASADRLE